MSERGSGVRVLCLGLAIAVLGWASAARARDRPFDPRTFTVWAFSQTGVSETDPQVLRLQPDVNLRGFQQWSSWGLHASDYDFAQLRRYHQEGIAFIGGGTASILLPEEFSTPAELDALSTRDARGAPVAHDYIVPNARRGSLANPAFRKLIVDWCKLQIDGGVDGLFLDEVIAGFGGGLTHNWNGNEGFEDATLADFNRYLLAKYPQFTPGDWKTTFGMTDDNLVRPDVPPDDLARNFDYRRYLQAHGWDGATGYADSPLVYLNPLAAEWGPVTTNRMYAGDGSFTAVYLRRYWKEIVDQLRAHARAAGRRILLTSNGVFPFVDFNSVGMYPYNPDEQTPDYRGADYVPVIDGHLNGAKSLLASYRYLRALGAQVSGDVPLVVFIDWPNDMMTAYLNLPLEERKDFWRIFGAEAYAAGIFPAFHLRDTVGSPTASDQGMLDFFVEHTRFYKEHRELYRDTAQAAGAVSVGPSTVAANLLTQRGGRRQLLHLVNHDYAQGIRPQGPFEVELERAARPRRVTVVSPDFPGARPLVHRWQAGKLRIRVEQLRYHDVVVIE